MKKRIHILHLKDINLLIRISILGDSLRAASILETLEKLCPNILILMVRRINLFRRRGDFDRVSSLYEQYIAATSEKKEITSSLAIKYARFCNKVWSSFLL